MQGAGDEFLARPRFAQDADSGFAGGHAINLRHHAAHRLAFPHNFMFAETAFQIAVLALQAAELEGVFDRKEKLVGRNRFFQKIQSAEARGTHRHFDVGLPGHHDDGGNDALRFQFFQKREAVFAGHDDVREDDVERLRGGQFESFIRIVADSRLMSFKTKCPRE